MLIHKYISKITSKYYGKSYFKHKNRKIAEDIHFP